MSLTIKQRIVNMRIAGASYEDIQRELKCDMDQISYHLNKDSKVNVSKKMRHGHSSELEAIQAYKERLGCIDCARDYPHFVLEFDHLPEFKKFGQVSHILKKYGPDKAWEEIAKCDVVCSNCHKLRTNARLFPQYDDILES
jgi:DNA-binding CsgD family transcriptional regulator